MRKVYVNLTVQLIIRQDDGVETSDVIDEMDYDFVSQTVGAEIEDVSIENMEVTDSK
jgi:hypothetical protein